MLIAKGCCRRHYKGTKVCLYIHSCDTNTHSVYADFPGYYRWYPRKCFVYEGSNMTTDPHPARRWCRRRHWWH